MNEIFSSHASQEPLIDRGCFWSTVGYLQDFDERSYCDRREGVSVLTLRIPNQKTRGLSKRRRLAQLLGDPRVGRRTRHRETHCTARRQFIWRKGWVKSRRTCSREDKRWSMAWTSSLRTEDMKLDPLVYYQTQSVSEDCIQRSTEVKSRRMGFIAKTRAFCL